MKKIVALLLLIASLPIAAQTLDAEALYEDLCTRCHGMEGYVWGRSFKAWQACVYTMQEYADDTDFTDDAADAVIEYLTANGGRIERELPPVAEPVTETTSEVAVSAEPAASSSRRAAFGTSAKVSGYFGAAALLCSLGSGLIRRKLKKRFRVVHRIAAAVLLATVLFHSAYYLSTFGMPPLLWFQVGVGATVLLLTTELGALFRRRFRRIFLKVHIAGAVIGLTATVIHWLWIYI